MPETGAEPAHNIRGEEPPVAIALTPAAFDALYRDNVLRVEPDLDAMAYIGGEVGFITVGESLPPLVLVTRDASPRQRIIGGWDMRLPVDTSSPDSGQYLSATELSSVDPRSFTREALARTAKGMGATALTEITMPGWTPTDREEHAALFASALLLGQRPLDLPPRRNIGLRIARDVQGAFGDTRQSLGRINAVRRHGPPLPEPFIVTYL
jgi:hypothetical protein